MKPSQHADPLRCSTDALRQKFLDFFQQHGHTVVPSASLLPADDPSLLFVNAGMVPFKNLFLGHEKRAYCRAVSSQRCLRTGGKHNDLEQVGYTARHHTFFEMLGNFSFGDYFKQQAIHYAWEFLTEVCQLPPQQLWVSVYHEDEEASAIWLDQIGIDKKRLSRIASDDNFWQMGDTGPCGPCSEIFYDHGPSHAGGPPGSADQDGDRYIEIWNLVFTQYNRLPNGELLPLAKPCVDTGMGLERLAAVMQGVHSNYDIDVFRHLRNAITAMGGAATAAESSIKVLADHIRSCCFLIADGLQPDNEGRGYALRRIIRRAVRHGHRLGFTPPFFYRLVSPLAAIMGNNYPALRQQEEHITQILRKEEERFTRTLEQGLQLLERHMATLTPGACIDGKTLFTLYDTYGFPLEIAMDVARENKRQIDEQGFSAHMQQQQQRARQASRFADVAHMPAPSGHSSFSGYQSQHDHGQIIGLYQKSQQVAVLKQGEKGVIALDKTPFYAEGGGQVGDRGTLKNDRDGHLEVYDCQRAGAVTLHIGKVVAGSFSPSEMVLAEVDSERRRATACNHSATHLLHASLRRQLGSHIQQKGSLVEPLRLRFDFSHHQALDNKQIQQIEAEINAQIQANVALETESLSMQEACQKGALALFGEKYQEPVRVLSIGDYSCELCGGTHVSRSGDIGFFKIVLEQGIAAGIRRIEALTGAAALNRIQQHESILLSLAGTLKTPAKGLSKRLQQMQQEQQLLLQQIQQLQQSQNQQQFQSLAQQAVTIHGIHLVVASLPALDRPQLRHLIDRLKQHLQPSLVLLATALDSRIDLVCGVSESLTDRLSAATLIQVLARRLGGKGGGRPHFAQGAGQDAKQLSAALATVPEWVQEQLNSKH